MELVEITPENLGQALALQTTVEQERFVSTVADSLEEARQFPQACPWYRLVVVDGEPVAFVMLSWDCVPDPPTIHGPWFLWKLLVDRRHQRRGYGRQIVLLVADLVRAHGATELLVSYVPGPGGPVEFYLGLGFVPTGEQDNEGEPILRLDLVSPGEG